MSADFGPCEDWPVQWVCDVADYDPSMTAVAVSAATRIVWALSGRRFGTCTVTLRPCAQGCYDAWPFGWLPWSWSTYSNLDASWTTSWALEYACAECRGTCSCAAVSEVVLPSPVSRIVQVTVDGSPMVTGAYRVDDNRKLVRTDGGRWPRCNNLNLDDSQPGTWSVTAAFGEDVPVTGKLAVGEMACEILKAMNGQDCRLPPGVTQLVRQGVTISIPDIGEIMQHGRTGLYLVDAFIITENPKKLATRSRVYGVDRITPRRAGT